MNLLKRLTLLDECINPELLRGIVSYLHSVFLVHGIHGCTNLMNSNEKHSRNIRYGEKCRLQKECKYRIALPKADCTI